jgi:hypothetical protein
LSTAILYDPKLFVILNQIDSDLAEKTRAQGCSCGGRLHTSNYPRKPRAPVDLGAENRKRHSFCCAECRRRETPPSVRFFGRRVYAFPIVVLLTALAAGLSSNRLATLRAEFGVCHSPGYCEPPVAGLSEPAIVGLTEPPIAGLAEPPMCGLSEPAGRWMLSNPHVLPWKVEGP